MGKRRDWRYDAIPCITPSWRNPMLRRLLFVITITLAVAGTVSSGGAPSKPAPLPDGLVAPNTVAEAAGVVAFLEGPAVDADGNVFFSDIAGNRILKMDPKGAISVFRADSGRT